MISRRLLRVKALQILYAYRTSDGDNLQKTEKELMFSIEKSYDLYHLMLLLPLVLADYADQRIQIAKAKYFPTEDEANPNTKFVDNRLITGLKEYQPFNRYLESRKLNWIRHEDLTKRLYRELLEWPVYLEYMGDTNDSFQQDKLFLIRMISDFLPEHEMLNQILEENSIYWNDDIEYSCSMVVKTLERWKESSSPRLLGMFKDDDDRSFVTELLRHTIVHGPGYEEMIRHHTENWDYERLALMDILIMQMAISEAVNFRNIPVKVTLNEYIDISKYYSTEKSNLFINGILDKIFNRLKEEKKITKTGRGLIGELNQTS